MYNVPCPFLRHNFTQKSMVRHNTGITPTITINITAARDGQRAKAFASAVAVRIES